MSNFDKHMTTTSQSKFRYTQTLSYLQGRIKPEDKVLDVGARTELTRLIESEFGVSIDNTHGDLNAAFRGINDIYYNVVICSHVLEHLFSPLNIMNWLKAVTMSDAKLYIMLPCRPKWLWTTNHYHEIDYYRLSALAAESGWQIVEWEYFKAWRNPLSYFTGIRMFLRLFFEWNVHYTLVKS